MAATVIKFILTFNLTSESIFELSIVYKILTKRV